MEYIALMDRAKSSDSSVSACEHKVDDRKKKKEEVKIVVPLKIQKHNSS